MSTFLIVMLIFIVLLITDVRAVMKQGCRRLKWFYSFCYIIGLVIAILYSFGKTPYGPSQLIMDIARSFSLV